MANSMHLNCPGLMSIDRQAKFAVYTHPSLEKFTDSCLRKSWSLLTWYSTTLRPFTLDTRTTFNAHWLHSHLNSVWGDANWMRIEPIHLWRWIGTELEPNSLFIHWITIKSCTVTPPRTATSSKHLLLGQHTCSIHRLRYELRWPVMLGQYWLDAAKKETAYQVISCSNWMDFSVCFDTSKMLAR